MTLTTTKRPDYHLLSVGDIVHTKSKTSEKWEIMLVDKAGYTFPEFHREDGPAYRFLNLTTGEAYRESWWYHGRRHRLDGPAITDFREAVNQQYWVNGKQYTLEEFNALPEVIAASNRALDYEL